MGFPRREALNTSRFGELVGKEREPRADGYSPSTAKRWEEGAIPDAEAIEAMISLARRHGLDWVTWDSLYKGIGWPEMPPQVKEPTPPLPRRKYDPSRDRKKEA